MNNNEETIINHSLPAPEGYDSWEDYEYDMECAQETLEVEYPIV